MTRPRTLGTLLTLLTFLMLLLAAVPACSETSQERGKHIIDQALTALGGRNFLAMRNRIESGRAYSFYREQLTGLSRAKIYTQYPEHAVVSSPDYPAVRERQGFGKDESNVVIFAEGQGYEITFRGARPLKDDVLERKKLSTLNNIFYILRVRLEEPGLIFDARGTDVFENQPVEIVEVSDRQNRSVSVYFSQSSNLPVRQVFYRRDPQTRERIEEISSYSKYRNVGGGVMWPFSIHSERNGEKIYEMYSETVVINQELKDSLFTLPPNLKILKK